MSLPSLSVCLSVSLSVSIRMSSGVLEASDPLELEVQVVSPVPRQLLWRVQKPLLAGDFHEDNLFRGGFMCVPHISLLLKLIIILCEYVCVHAVDCRHTYHGTHGG